MRIRSTSPERSPESQQQLRKVAILVATLDAKLAEKLLADLPAREAAQVRALLDDLEEIDPAEQQAVFAAFRKGISATPQPQAEPQVEPLRTQVEGVELDASLLARLDEVDGRASHIPPAPTPQECDWQTLSEADAVTLVEILSAEQPQTIAIVLSRLETPRAAELVSKLSPTLQTEVLERLADLDPADEQTLEVVASQLAQWISAQSQRHQRRAAGRDLVQRILQETPDSQRAVLLTRLSKRSPGLAEKLVAKPRDQQPTMSSAREDFIRPFSSRHSAELPAELPATLQPPTLHNTYSAPARISSSTHTTPSPLPIDETTDVNDPLSELERLDEKALLAALQLADRETVMLALAGVSEPLMRRIVRDLPRRQARQFRQQVRAIGPTRLSDMLAAQHELVRIGLASATQ